MSDEPKRRGGGAKPSRTETVTVRLDPKLRYLAEIAARKQRRTLSSYVEWAVEKSLEDVKLYEGSGYNGDESTTVAEAATLLWDVDEAERFVKLAIRYPELLTHEEQERWKMLHDAALLHPARGRNSRSGEVVWNWATLEDRVLPDLRRYWSDLLEAQNAGPLGRAAWVRKINEELEARGVTFSYATPKTPPKSSSGFDDMDADIPF
ncbi:hypothetical protein EJP67_16475 [Variovorax guangxiensis]|uniref:Uncharacterized protein n=1 Tax=Variovorax guangxiensis TaxID=1775474 RepID=A0A433MKQ0_9BURK|nr:hypothetical protein [Variovorax guangxiensis]RUR68659.1 hypothetical protein EJP67_16475 [Variovorax guangxiensis]